MSTLKYPPDTPMTSDTQKFDDVREIVRARLVQLARGGGEFRETYLMSDGKFSGVRFELGAFNAVWNLDQTDVRVFREKQQILVLSLAGTRDSERRAA